jgi:glycine cleavage system H protein
MTIPKDLRYTTDHEWLRVEGDIATVGITSYAGTALGDVVFLGLPTIGSRLTAGGICGEVESTKSVSDLYAPVNGEVLEVNDAAVGDPSLVNADPYGEGWLFRVRLEGSVDLLDSDAYAAIVVEN